MLPHSFDALPHASDHAVNFTKVDFDKLHPTLLTADTLFIKIHGKFWVLVLFFFFFLFGLNQFKGTKGCGKRDSEIETISDVVFLVNSDKRSCSLS